MQAKVDIRELQSLLSNVLERGVVIGSRNTIRISYECVSGSTITESLDSDEGGFNAKDIFQYIVSQADQLCFTLNKEGDRFSASILLSFALALEAPAEILMSVPTKGAILNSDIGKHIRRAEGSASVEDRFIPNIDFNPNNPESVERCKALLLEWFDKRAEKRDVVNFPALSRWNRVKNLIDIYKSTGHFSVIKEEPETIECYNFASASLLFQGEGDFSTRVWLTDAQKDAFAELIYVADNFMIDAGLDNGYSGVSFEFGIDDVMI